MGGLVGLNSGGTIRASYSFGSVNADTAGGLVGYNLLGKIDYSFSTDSTTGNRIAGGLVGLDSTTDTLHSNYASGKVIGHATPPMTETKYGAGGLIGCLARGGISSSYSTGNVFQYDSLNIGGLIGQNFGSIDSSYSAGVVNNEYGTPGSLVGVNKGSVHASFYNSDLTKQSQSGATTPSIADLSSTPLNTQQMKSAASFAVNAGGTWDFTNTWAIYEGQTYPYLRGLDNAPFAFTDTLYSAHYFSMSRLLAQDYDGETSQKNLIFRVDSMSAGAGSTDSATILNFPYTRKAGDTIAIKYRVGEVRASIGDTLWGNRVVDRIIVQPFALAFAADTLHTYGDKPFTYAQHYSGKPLAIKASTDSVFSISDSTFTIKGSGTVVLSAMNSDSEIVQQIVRVAKAPLTIGVLDTTIAVGDAEPQYTFTFAGFVNDEDSIVLKGLAATRESGTSAGTYSITPQASAKNYSLTFLNGSLTITAPVLTRSLTHKLPVADLEHLRLFDLLGRKVRIDN